MSAEQRGSLAYHALRPAHHELIEALRREGSVLSSTAASAIETLSTGLECANATVESLRASGGRAAHGGAE